MIFKFVGTLEQTKAVEQNKR